MVEQGRILRVIADGEGRMSITEWLGTFISACGLWRFLPNLVYRERERDGGRSHHFLLSEFGTLCRVSPFAGSIRSNIMVGQRGGTECLDAWTT